MATSRMPGTAVRMSSVIPRPMYPAPTRPTRIGLPCRSRSSSALSTMIISTLLPRHFRMVEQWPAVVGVGDDRDGERPADIERRIVVSHSAGGGRRIELRRLIPELTVIAQSLIAVGE